MYILIDVSMSVCVCVCVCVYVQGVGAELGLQQPPPLQQEHGDVEGVHIRIGWGSTGHQFP